MKTTDKINELSVFMSDMYKFGHLFLFPKNTTYAYSTLTPRNNAYFKHSDKMVVFGYEMFAHRYLVEHYNKNFFELPLETVLEQYKYVIGSALGDEMAETAHIKQLHELGYLPIRVKALPEGTLVPMGVPVLTIDNTHKDFAWLTNFLETLMISETFVTATVATMALELKKVAMKYSLETCDNNFHIPYQCHDFSERGQHGNGAAQLSGIGHLTSFVGSDTVQAAIMAHNYYGADLQSDNILKSVLASEHAVMQSYGKENEYHTYQELINRFPNGILSLVSDTWDYYAVLTEILPFLKNEIMARNGKLVIRPDSGNPIDIIAGTDYEVIDDLNVLDVFTNPNSTETQKKVALGKYFSKFNNRNGKAHKDFVIGSTLFSTDIWVDSCSIGVEIGDITAQLLTPEHKGSLQLLWETFGGAINDAGYRVLDDSIGLLYGEGITVDTMGEILERMKNKGFASSNIVFGVGAYVYSVAISRDTFGQAVKSQLVVVDGEERQTFKAPKTDSKKKSLKGRVAVFLNQNDEYYVEDGYGRYENKDGDQLRIIFQDGELYNKTPFKVIRKRIESNVGAE